MLCTKQPLVISRIEQDIDSGNADRLKNGVIHILVRPLSLMVR